jgi:hypothetical protein
VDPIAWDNFHSDFTTLLDDFHSFSAQISPSLNNDAYDANDSISDFEELLLRLDTVSQEGLDILIPPGDSDWTDETSLLTESIMGYQTESLIAYLYLLALQEEPENAEIVAALDNALDALEDQTSDLSESLTLKSSLADMPSVVIGITTENLPTPSEEGSALKVTVANYGSATSAEGILTLSEGQDIIAQADLAPLGGQEEISVMFDLSSLASGEHWLMVQYSASFISKTVPVNVWIIEQEPVLNWWLIIGGGVCLLAGIGTAIFLTQSIRKRQG